jgi:glycosyltransferase involved in cell wall biosynthesis
MLTTIDVLIPSLGRNSLNTSLESVYGQTLKPARVIVVDDSKSQDIRAQDFSFPVSVLKTGGRKGPSVARNLGVCNSTADWVALLDDDDKWSADHLELLNSFALNATCDIAISSAIVGGLIRPKAILDSSKHPLIQIYGDSSGRSTKFFLPTPGMLIKRKVFETVCFDESMKEREDLLFLADVFSAGFRISQSCNATALISSHRLKSIRRTNLTNDLHWSEFLEEVEYGLGRNFLRGVGLRNSILRLEPLETLKLIYRLLKTTPI